jgi:hypothetical protein
MQDEKGEMFYLFAMFVPTVCLLCPRSVLYEVAVTALDVEEVWQGARSRVS